MQNHSSLQPLQPKQAMSANLSNPTTSTNSTNLKKLTPSHEALFALNPSPPFGSALIGLLWKVERAL